MKRIAFILLCMCLVLPLSAQKREKQRKFDHEDFRRKMEMFIVEEAGLSEKEATKFFPIYHEMKEKQMKLGHKIMKLKRAPQEAERDDDDDDDDDFDDDEDWAEAAIEIEELKVKQAQIGETYTRQLCKVISGEKVFKAMKAEDAFHRQMLKGFHKGGERRNNGNR